MVLHIPKAAPKYPFYRPRHPKEIVKTTISVFGGVFLSKRNPKSHSLPSKL